MVDCLRVNKCFLVTAGLAAVLAGCSQGPTPIDKPAYNASGAGSKAMELYDKDGDGKVAGAELDQAPTLKAALKTLDTDGDKAVSADEIAARVKSWQANPAALTGVKANVTLDGQPLAGAEVTFEPDPCLGDAIKLGRGTTTMYGDVNLAIPEDQRPSANYPGGMQLGLYVVRVSKVVNGKETIPARYNAQSTLGQQVAYDDPAFKGRSIAFALKSTP